MQPSMQSLQVEGSPLRPRRVLRREWKRNKPVCPHLQYLLEPCSRRLPALAKVDLLTDSSVDPS